MKKYNYLSKDSNQTENLLGTFGYIDHNMSLSISI